MRKPMFIIGWLLCFHSTWAIDIPLYQKGTIDSLSRLVPNLKGEEQVDALLMLGYYQSYQNLSEGIQSLKLAEELATGLQYRSGLGFCLVEKGALHYLQGQYVTAFRDLNKALDLANQDGDELLKARSFHQMALIHREFENNNYALRYINEALKRYDLLEDNFFKGEALKDRGMIHLSQGEFNSSLADLEASIAVRQDIGDELGLARTYQSLARYHQQLGNTKETLSALDNATIYYAEDLNVAHAQVIMDRGMFAFEDGRLEEAFSNLSEAMALLSNGRQDFTQGLILLQIAKMKLDANELEQARSLTRTAMDLANRNNYYTLRRNALRFLFDLSLSQAEYRTSLAYHIRYHALKDSILTGFQQEQSVGLLKILQDSEIQELTARSLSQERALDIQRTNANLITAGMIILVVLSVFLLRTIIRERSTAKILLEKNEYIEMNNQELSTLNQEKNHLIHMVSHDVRSPLNNIIGLITMMKEDEDLSEEQEKYLNMIHSSAEKLNTMTKKILDIESVEKKEKNLVIEKTNLGQIVNEEVEIYRNSADKKKISLHTNINGEEINAFLDKSYFTNILDNLLSNAIKFSEYGKNVWVNLSENRYKVKLEVKDEGPGIAEEDKHKLFKKFQKLSNKPTGGEDSTGLGLSIVAKMAEDMNGKIYCESKQGEGASFIVEIPKGFA